MLVSYTDTLGFDRRHVDDNFYYKINFKKAILDNINLNKLYFQKDGFVLYQKDHFMLILKNYKLVSINKNKCYIEIKGTVDNRIWKKWNNKDFLSLKLNKMLITKLLLEEKHV